MARDNRLQTWAAVHADLLNASLTDGVFTMSRHVTVQEINALSGIVDGPSTMVIDGTMVKVLVWYDNEFGYVHRMAELAAKVAAAMAPTALQQHV